MRTKSLKVLPVKPGVGQYVAIQAAKNFFLANSYSSGSFTCICFKNLYQVFPVLAVANTGSCVGLQNKIGLPANCHRQLMKVPVLSARGIVVGSKTCI